MESFTGVAVFAIVIFAISAIMSAVPVFFKDMEKYLHTLVAISTGIMIGVLFLMILPEAIEEGGEAGHEPIVLMSLVLAGFIGVFICDFVFKAKTPGVHSHEFTSMAAFWGLVIHAAFDGVSLAAGFVAGDNVGLLILVAICLHKCAEIFSLSSTMALALDRKKTVLYMLGFSAVTPLAALISYFIISGEVGLTGPAMALSGGILLFVIVCDLLPELLHKLEGKSPYTRLASFLFGLAVAVAVWFAMNALTGGSGI